MPHDGRHRTLTLSPARLALAVVVAAAAGAVVALVVSHHPGGHPAHTASPVTGGSSTTTAAAPPSPPPPMRVMSVTPADGAVGVSPDAVIAVSFSATISPSSPMPTVTPPGLGTWRVTGRRIVFVPDMSFLPLAVVRIVVPAGPSGMTAKDGSHLARGVVDSFRLVQGSTERLQQLLALLDYSPLAFHPSGPALSNGDEVAQRAALFTPPPGRLSWRTHTWPRQLVSLWRPGHYNVFTRGLVMEFEADHGLPPKGVRTEAFWQALLSALASGDLNTGGYNYALGDQAVPETFTLWHDGRIVMRVPANTGISQAPTADGNFPVYERLRHQIMKGTNPDGTKYADPVQFVAYFNGGDAVHYFPRAAYGIPQSLGCIELQLGDAAKAWPYLAYGTIVSVIS